MKGIWYYKSIHGRSMLCMLYRHSCLATLNLPSNLSLSTISSIVHGGNIKAESDGIKGAKFTVTLSKN